MDHATRFVRRSNISPAFGPPRKLWSLAREYVWPMNVWMNILLFCENVLLAWGQVPEG
jgi:hypothetical protein